ncbi:MAG: hypothetical protein WB586_14280 [Chthoniobacterales bacterium]
MSDGLIYTDSRPRAKSTGQAFGFEGNLSMPVIIAALVSVFLLTMLFSGKNSWPMVAKFALALTPTILTAGYIILLRNRKPPRFDLDLFSSWVNGRAFGPPRNQPVHPFLPPR